MKQIKFNFNKKILFLLALPFLMFGCSSDESKSAKEAEFEKGVGLKDVDKGVKEKVEKIIYSIPSPIQVSSIIKNSGANYMGEVLNSHKNAEKYYSTNAGIALNLGIYGTDLGYACLYDKTQDAISYLTATKKLSDALGILGAFEVSTIERFEDNLDNKDSLISIISESFRMSDLYLKENERNSLGALILTGSWIEALYLATKIVEKHPLQPIITRIGEQKKSLNNLILLLSDFETEKRVTELLTVLNELKQVYEGVNITETYAAPTTNSQTGITTINSKSEVVINTDTLAKISEKVAAVRNSIIS